MQRIISKNMGNIRIIRNIFELKSYERQISERDDDKRFHSLDDDSDFVRVGVIAVSCNINQLEQYQR